MNKAQTLHVSQQVKGTLIHYFYSYSHAVNIKQVQNPNVGNNPVGGKTYYPYSSEKIVFAADGSYTGYSARYGDGDYDLDAYGRYKWDISETGTYTWNENTNTVTLRLEKRSGLDGNLLDKAEFKSFYTTYMNKILADKMEEEGWTQAQLDEFINQQLAKMGYSSLTQYIDAIVNEAFANHPYTYFFKNGSLLMQEALPEPKGTDELAGKTYNGTMSDDDDHRVKDPNDEYVFGANKTYTHTETYYDPVHTETGSYSYDSTRKKVYFGIGKVNGKTAAEYYDTVTIWGENHFVDEDAYKAAETNSRFRYNSQDYDPDRLLIGWVD